MIYTVTLNPALDYTVWVSDFEVGKTNRAAREALCFGGKGINVSAVLTALGEPSVALGFAAGFVGEALCNMLHRAHVTQDFVRLSQGETRINIKLKTGGETEINASGPDVPPDAIEALLAKLDMLCAGDTLVLAGSVPRSVPSDIYEQMLFRIRGREIRVVADAEKALLLPILPYRPFLIKPNLRELCDMVGRELVSDHEIVQAARELQKAGAQNVLVSLGGQGALLLDEQGEVHREGAVGGAAVNTVGAGDSMLAGFLCGVKGGYAHALCMGLAAGGATACKVGLATGEEITRLMQEK
ncbi:MAG: 1-phosphofructokinase [Clostridia bacterium]|nr:1-phosphofructokinase [Clostridia bacterium]